MYTALFCPYDVADGAVWSTILPKAFNKGAKGSLTEDFLTEIMNIKFKVPASTFLNKPTPIPL